MLASQTTSIHLRAAAGPPGGAGRCLHLQRQRQPGGRGQYFWGPRRSQRGVWQVGVAGGATQAVQPGRQALCCSCTATGFLLLCSPHPALAPQLVRQRLSRPTSCLTLLKLPDLLRSPVQPCRSGNPPRRMPNTYVVGLDVTHKCVLTAAQINGMEGQGRHGTFLRSITQFYLDYHR